MQGQLSEIFPQINNYHENPLTGFEIEELGYFKKYQGLLHSRQFRGRGQKVQDCFKLIKVQKGTVLYFTQQLAERGYIILTGCVQLLSRKNSRQKLQNFPGHFAHTNQDKINFITQNFKIPKDAAQRLIDNFYQEKIEYKYLPAIKLYSYEDFGFGEMVRNTTRTQAAIAIEKSQLLVIQKEDFDTHLRDFQIKKETYLISKLIQRCHKDLKDDVAVKLTQIMNCSHLQNLEKDQVIISEGEWPSHLYFLIRGQVQIRKKISLQVPKKYLKDQNRGKLQREVIVTLSKISQNSYIGESQILLNKKNRQFSVVVSHNNTLILKIDHTTFLKGIVQFTKFQKQLYEDANMKRKYLQQKYDKQLNKITKTFMAQYEDFDNKKKQKMLSNFLGNQDNNHDLFEVYAPEGVFYRDTFEKLEGFDQNQKQVGKSTAIKRFKMKNTSSTQISPSKYMPESTIIDKNDNKKDINQKQKKLFSPKKSMNPIDFIMETPHIQKSSFQDTLISPKNVQISDKKSVDQKQQTRMKQLRRQYKSLGKFQQIKKDQNVFKRVMIKHGIYPIDRNIDKSKATKPLIHHNFDDVVKQCISRKNNIIKRVQKHQQDQIVLDTFNRTLKTLKNQSASHQTFKFSRFSTPCKGTQQMKKRMQSIHNTPSRMSNYNNFGSYKNSDHKIEDCIGINKKPKSSENTKKNNASSMMSNHSHVPQKLVLLNHMMKPITYYNFNSNDL